MNRVIFLLNIVWTVILVLSFLSAAVSGRMTELSASAVSGADKAVKLVVSMAGTMCFWSGVMKIAEKSRLTDIMSKAMYPVLKRLMPEHRDNARAMAAVSANITANILGLGNAATPLGITAMKEMKKSSPLKDAPDNGMVMFVVLNTASVQLIPSTIAALRQAAGSVQPYDILTYVWTASVLALLAGIIAAKLMSGSGTYSKTIRG